MNLPISDYSNLANFSSDREAIRVELRNIAYDAGFRFGMGNNGGNSFNMLCQGKRVPAAGENGRPSPCPHQLKFRKRGSDWTLQNVPAAHNHGPDSILDKVEHIPLEERLAAIRHGPGFSWERVVKYFAAKGKAIDPSIKDTLSDLHKVQSEVCYCGQGCKRLPLDDGEAWVRAASEAPEHGCYVQEAMSPMILRLPCITLKQYETEVLQGGKVVIVSRATEDIKEPVPGMESPPGPFDSYKQIAALVKNITEPFATRGGSFQKQKRATRQSTQQGTSVQQTEQVPLQDSVREFAQGVSGANVPPLAILGPTAKGFDPGEIVKTFGIEKNEEQNAWRKLGFAQANAATNWHADYGCAQLITLLRGHKRWFFYVCDDASSHSLQTSETDDLTDVPGIARKPILWVDQLPGETLLFPPSTFHAVYSFEDSILAGSDFYTKTYWARAKYGIDTDKRSGERHPKYGVILRRAIDLVVNGAPEVEGIREEDLEALKSLCSAAGGDLKEKAERLDANTRRKRRKVQ